MNNAYIHRPPRHALIFGRQKINLHQAGKEFEPKAHTALPGTADLCFLTKTPIREVHKELRSQKFEILEGGNVVDRTGAVGKLKSVYIRDPDQNLIEYAIARALQACTDSSCQDLELRMNDWMSCIVQNLRVPRTKADLRIAYRFT